MIRNILQDAIRNPKKIPLLVHRFKVRFIDKYIKPPYGKPIVHIGLCGYDFAVHTWDTGLSAELIRSGIREPYTTKAYQNQLKNLQQVVDNPTILELGANIGYYIIVADEVLKNDYKTIAIEMEPRNIELLKLNTANNDIDGNVDIINAGIAETSAIRGMYITSRSNHHSLHESTYSEGNEEFQIRTNRVDDIFKNRSYELCDVNVIRMDIQGYEEKVLQTLSTIINGEHPLILNIEIHPSRMSDKGTSKVIELLQKSGCEICSAAQDYKFMGVQSYEEIPKNIEYLEIVASRGV